MLVFAVGGAEKIRLTLTRRGIQKRISEGDALSRQVVAVWRYLLVCWRWDKMFLIRGIYRRFNDQWAILCIQKLGEYYHR